MEVTRILPAIMVERQNGIFGGDEYYVYGQKIFVMTKYRKSAVGKLSCYEIAMEEGIQDMLVLTDQDGKEIEIGVNDIIEVKRYG